MGGFCTPSYTELPSATQTVEGTEIPEWVAAAGREIFSTATDIAGSDYPIYTGERSATYDGSRLTEDERRGMEILRSGAENYLPYMNRASAIANTLGQGYDAASRAELMGSPYSGASRDYLEGDFKDYQQMNCWANIKARHAMNCLVNIKAQHAMNCLVNMMVLHAKSCWESLLVQKTRKNTWTYINSLWTQLFEKLKSKPYRLKTKLALLLLAVVHLVGLDWAF